MSWPFSSWARSCCASYVYTIRPLGSAVFPYPKQPFLHAIDLIYQGQVLVSSLPLALVHPEGRNSIHMAVRKSPGNCVFYRSKDVLPRGVKHFGNFFPRQMTGPSGQKPTITVRQLVLAVSPGNLLHFHTTFGTLHPTHDIHEEHLDLPQPNIGKPPYGSPIVARPFAVTARTNGSASLAWPNRNFHHVLIASLSPMWRSP